MTGLYITAASLKKSKEKHDQKVADNFKAAIRLDNSTLVTEIKEAAPNGKALSIEQARSLARDRSSITQGLIPESHKTQPVPNKEAEPAGEKRFSDTIASRQQTGHAGAVVHEAAQAETAHGR